MSKNGKNYEIIDMTINYASPRPPIDFIGELYTAAMKDGKHVCMKINQVYIEAMPEELHDSMINEIDEKSYRLGIKDGIEAYAGWIEAIRAIREDEDFDIEKVKMSGQWISENLPLPKDREKGPKDE